MSKPAMLALRQARDTCTAHRDALRDALNDLRVLKLTAAELEQLTKDDRRLLDQFAYRYTRLQDDMGARLFPAVLRALGEDIAAMPVLDRLIRLEQLGWLPSADEWSELRRIRNEFAHDYPETTAQRFERLQLALSAAEKLMKVLDFVDGKIRHRFTEMEA
jgi:hypothetical protein